MVVNGFKNIMEKWVSSALLIKRYKKVNLEVLKDINDLKIFVTSQLQEIMVKL